HTLVRRDDEERHIYSADAGQHVLDEALVPRHVHDAGLAPTGQGQPGEAEVNRHAARLLLGQAIGINAGERADAGGFAVVYMPGGSDAAHTRDLTTEGA